jgi:proline iminopeptidase
MMRRGIKICPTMSSFQRIECNFGTFPLQRTITSLPKQNQPRLCISYRIIHPSLLNNTALAQTEIDSTHPAAPLLVVHGGPSLPSEYLTPLANHIHNRSIIFYDQLGCGWSSMPRQKEWYGVTQMSQDLEELVHHLKEVWKVQSFHLLGHSLGGVIGYEYLKSRITAQNLDERRDMPQCLSFILSNTSTNLALSSSEQKRLFQKFQLQQSQTQKRRMSIGDEFFQTHICRTRIKPVELESALSRLGMDWSANDYCVTPPPPVPDLFSKGSNTKNTMEASASIAATTTTDSVNRFPPVLIIRGQHDFVTEICTRGWFEIFDADGIREVILEDCAHYPHLEQPQRYSYQIENFCSVAESRHV